MSSFKAKYEKMKTPLKLSAPRHFINKIKKIKDMIPLWIFIFLEREELEVKTFGMLDLIMILMDLEYRKRDMIPLWIFIFLCLMDFWGITLNH